MKEAEKSTGLRVVDKTTNQTGFFLFPCCLKKEQEPPEVLVGWTSRARAASGAGTSPSAHVQAGSLGGSQLRPTGQTRHFI